MQALKQTWVKTTKAQKEAWMMAEYGRYEDSGKSRSHVYNEIRGSYWASMYLQSGGEDVSNATADKIVNSFVFSTFREQNPKMWTSLKPKLIEAMTKIDREDLANLIRTATK